jgi:hypothetical protein
MPNETVKNPRLWYWYCGSLKSTTDFASIDEAHKHFDVVDLAPGVLIGTTEQARAVLQRRQHVLRGRAVQYWFGPAPRDGGPSVRETSAQLYEMGQYLAELERVAGQDMGQPLPYVHHKTYADDCPTCKSIREEHNGIGPSHYGSRNCQSGSPASGGSAAHCTCDSCF